MTPQKSGSENWVLVAIGLLIVAITLGVFGCRCGSDSSTPPSEPAPPAPPPDPIGVTTDGAWVCAPLASGNSACWGGTTGPAHQHDRREYPAGVVDTLAAGRAHTCMLNAGEVHCWGGNGGHGLAARSERLRAVFRNRLLVALPSLAVDLVSTGDTTCAALENGETWCWGTHFSESAPHPIPGLAGADRLVAGSGLVCGFVAEEVVCGVGDYGAHALEYGPNPALSGAVDLAIGDRHACYIDAAGSIHCTGRDGYGQLGIPGAGRRRDWAPLGLPGPFTAIDAGEAFTCALNTDQTVWCWGRNNRGQTGLSIAEGSGESTEPSQRPPSRIPDLSGVTELDLGDVHACAYVPAEGVWCWGANGRSQMGDYVDDQFAPYLSMPRP